VFRDPFTAVLTVVCVYESNLPAPLAGVLARVESLRTGLLAASSLPPGEACAEAVLLVDDAIGRCELVPLVSDGDALSAGDVRLLVTAERRWLKVLREMLVADPGESASSRLARVLESFPS
jgi:hypothetical protein